MTNEQNNKRIKPLIPTTAALVTVIICVAMIVGMVRAYGIYSAERVENFVRQIWALKKTGDSVSQDYYLRRGQASPWIDLPGAIYYVKISCQRCRSKDDINDCATLKCKPSPPSGKSCFTTWHSERVQVVAKCSDRYWVHVAKR